MAHVYRRPFDYAQRVRRDVQPHSFAIELSKASLTFTSFVFDFNGTVTASATRASPSRPGVFRKRWNYEERVRRDVLPHITGIEFGTTLSLAPQAFSLTATPAAGQGSASRASVPRIGVYRKYWNYHERFALPEMLWVEAPAVNTVEITRRTITFVARQINFLLSPALDFTRPSISMVPRVFDVQGAGSVTTLSRASILFTPGPFAINPGQGDISLTTGYFSLQARQWLVTQAQPEYALVNVLAYRNGHYGGLYRYAGDVFAITSPLDFSPYWMTFVDVPPDSWTPFLPSFNAKTDREIASTPQTAEQAKDWVDTGVR